MVQPDYSAIECNVCKKPGGIHKRQVRRFSTPVFAIGWILLVPSLMGVLGGGLMTCGGLVASGAGAAKVTTDLRTDLARLGLNEDQIAAVEAEPYSDVNALVKLGVARPVAPRVVDVVTTANAAKLGAAAGAGCVGAMSAGMMLTSFVGGLLGWLLIGKRRILACRNCGGIHADTAI